MIWHDDQENQTVQFGNRSTTPDRREADAVCRNVASSYCRDQRKVPRPDCGRVKGIEWPRRIKRLATIIKAAALEKRDEFKKPCLDSLADFSKRTDEIQFKNWNANSSKDREPFTQTVTRSPRQRENCFADYSAHPEFL